MASLRFEPLYQKRVWGGRKLASVLNRRLPIDGPVGESWEIVDRPEAQSRVADGPAAGNDLRGLIAADAEAVMGSGWPADRPFPILVKWLDCRERLSLQVHPPAAIAADLGGEPKTENWFIAEADEGAALMAGLVRGVDRERFEQSLKAGTLEPLVHRLSVRAGESLFVPSGRLHAIDGGNLILEIQQNSDTTYRVYDWGRVGLDGKPRQLHVEQSLQSINFDDFEPATIKPQPGEQTLVESDVFRLRKIEVAAGARFEVPAGEPQILSVVSGHGRFDGDPAERGANALVPAAEAATVTAEAAMTLLVTDGFGLG